MVNDFTLWDAVKHGGFVTYFLGLCSFVSLTIIVERFIYYYTRSRVSRESFMRTIRQLLEKKDIKKALMICDEVKSPMASVVAAGLNSFQTHADEKDLAESLERKVIINAHDLERRIVIVGTIGSTAVYIGLLGTVWGIIQAFRDISQMGSGGINIVIKGISEALVCTAAGLVVSIPAVMAYNYFIKVISNFVVDMELCASEVTSLLKRTKEIKVK